MLQVQMDNLVVQPAGILEDNRSNRRFVAPLPKFLVRLPSHAERVNRVGPRWIGPFSLVNSREGHSLWSALVWFVRKWFEWLGPKQFQGTRNRGAEVLFVQSDAFLGRL